jgi:hypothetical protein
MESKQRHKIENYLIGKKIRPSIKGFDYLVLAIELVSKDVSYKRAITKRLYPDIAKEFNESASKVERAIRHAIDASKSTLKSSEFIALADIEIRHM